MLTYSDTAIEQTLRDARLLFEKLNKVLYSPNEATEEYRLNIEQLVETYKASEDTNALKVEIKKQYDELKQLL